MSEHTPHVHSTRGGWVAPDWPALTLPEASEVCEQAHRAGPFELLWTSPRPYSAASRVKTRDGDVFIKRHHVNVRSAMQLAEEHAFIRHLAARTALAPRLIADVSGQTVFVRGDWVYEIYAPGAGIDAYRDAHSWTFFRGAGHARAAGAALAEIHRASREFQAPSRSAHVLVANFRSMNAPEPLVAIESELERRPALRAALHARPWRREVATVLLPWHEAYHALDFATQACWGHHDWHASNLLWSSAAADARVTSALDFGLSDRSCTLFDLATGIERNCIAWLEIHEGRPARADVHAALSLLEGYGGIDRVSAAERRALAAMLPIVHVDFALSEIEYFYGIIHSQGNTRLAYEKFLLGHARWFASSEGRELLQAIENRE